MIKRFEDFKMFENYGNETAKDVLLDAFGEKYIEEYYMENYNIDIEDIAEYRPDIIKSNIDDDSFISDYIENEINNLNMNDYSDYDYKEYIKYNSTSEIESEVIKFYKEYNDIDDSDDITSEIDGKVKITKNKKDEDLIIITDKNNKSKKYVIPENYSIIVYDGDTISSGTALAIGEELEYDDSMLEDLNEDQLREVIENCDKEEDFYEVTINDRYKGYDAIDIFEEYYGKSATGAELYKFFSNYLNDDDIIKEYKDNEGFEYKQEYILQSLEDDSLIEYLINKDNKNILSLVDYLVEEGINPDESNEYDFQNKYIEQKVLNYFNDSEHDQKEEEEIIADALYFLNKNFDLNWQIEEEYSDYLWKIASDNYNL